ncbi:tetratricopeptide repeat protein [Nocardia sp. NPDC004340]
MVVMIASDPGARARLAADLNELRAQVGGPSFRVMAALLVKAHRDAVSATTLRDAATADASVPRPVTVFQFVTACRLHAGTARPDIDPACFDLEDWYGRWKKIGAPPDPAAAGQLASLESVAGEPDRAQDTAGVSSYAAAGVPGESGRVVVGRIPRRAPHFVDRTQLEDLREALRTASVAVVVTGMRGAGKTQVAAAYAREVIAAGDTPVVGWINAETRDSLYIGLVELAARVGVADPEGDSAVSARRVREYLSERQAPALLVLDNATDPDFLDNLLPSGGATRVVLTSTDRAFAQFGALVDARQGFERDESIRYLDEATGLHDPDGADGVAADLGDLPLALSAAAATLTGRRLDYGRYRHLLAAQPMPQALPRRRGSAHPLAVDQALLLAIATAETSSGDPQSDQVLRWLLGVMAMLAPDGIDYTLLPAPHDDPSMVDAAVQRCVEGSLLTWSGTGTVVVMHRLLARVVRERAHATHTFGQITAAAVAVIASWQFPEDQAFQRRVEGSRLIDHIDAVWATISGTLEDLNTTILTDILTARRWATRQLIKASDTTRSITLAYHTLCDHERVLGAEHPNILASRNNLAYAYESAGRLPEATALYERTLTDRERVLGAEHPDTLASRSNLAGAYRSAGRSPEAIALFERTLTDLEEVLGTEHPYTLTTRNNLAGAYRSAGRLPEATALYERTLTDRERVLGAEHPNTLTTRNNVAYAYESAGRLLEAIALYERTLTDSEGLLGAEHPNTLAYRNNLAGAYRSAGRLPEAIALFEPTLTDRERVLGAEHPDTLNTRNNLASAYESAGRLPEATALYERTLTNSEGLLGAEHPDTLTYRNNLAGAYRSAGRLPEATALYERTLTDRERVLGAEHPDTLTIRNNLAGAYESAGRLPEATALYERTLTDLEGLLGAEHPNTLTTRNNLAGAYRSAGRLPEAIALLERNLTDSEEVLGAEHPNTLTYRNNLASAYRSAGRSPEAIALFERTLTDSERILGPDHPTTSTVRRNLTSARKGR